jgi:hypothetical protein
MLPDMQELAWLAEVIRIWAEGGTWAEIKAAPGFAMLVGLAAALVPSSLILVGIGGFEEWRDTPIARWFGVSPVDPDADWAERARDIDKDGQPDF